MIKQNKRTKKVKEEKDIIDEIDWKRLKERLSNPEEQKSSIERLNKGLEHLGITI